MTATTCSPGWGLASWPVWRRVGTTHGSAPEDAGVAIGVDCPCGKSLSNWADNVPFLADFLPEQNTDAYCGAIEDAIRQHSGSPEITAASAIDRTVELFRQAWQCPA